MTANSTPLERLVANANDLYSLPRVAAEVLELTRDPQVDARRLKECIENDPALTAKLLRVVNSSLFGLSRHVRDLNQALALLGTTPLKLLVLAFCLPEGLFRGLGAEFLSRYWRRTLITAVAARQIAEDVWRTSGDEAFLAGLLHEVGLLVLLQQHGETYVRFSERVHAVGGDLCAAERGALGFDHAELTGELLACWKLPETLVAAARLPRDPERFERLPPTKRALPQILHLAELLAEILADGTAGRWPDLVAVGRRYHDLSPQRIERLIDGLQAKVEQLAQILSLELPRGESYQDVMQQAHVRLRALAEDAGGDIASRDLANSQEVALWEESKALAAEAAAAARSPMPHAVSPDPAADCLPATSASTVVSPRQEPIQDEGLLARTATAAAICRQRRQPMSVLLVELDSYENLVFSLGSAQAQRILSKIDAASLSLDLSHVTRVEIGEGLFALLLPGTDRQRAARAGSDLIEALRAWPATKLQQRALLRLNVGVASVPLPPSNFNARDFIAAAQRCL
ncbi:MAG: HDOD domain-containing protein, partial [Pirellulales bacterium]